MLFVFCQVLFIGVHVAFDIYPMSVRTCMSLYRFLKFIVLENKRNTKETLNYLKEAF